MKITDIVTKCNSQYGAPMGRANKGNKPTDPKIKVYTKKVQLIDAYDIGGAYWGWPNNLYVEFTKDLTYINYYRKF